jgi:hypothetical protein
MLLQNKPEFQEDPLIRETTEFVLLGVHKAFPQVKPMANVIALVPLTSNL